MKKIKNIFRDGNQRFKVITDKHSLKHSRKSYVISHKSKDVRHKTYDVRHKIK